MHGSKPKTHTDDLEHLEQQLAEPADLCDEYAAEMFRESFRAFWEAQLLSKELEEMERRRAKRAGPFRSGR
jgi:hypothetical protein